MYRNMGTLDRLLRVLIAAVIAFAFFTDRITGTTGIILIVLAGIFLLTSMIGTCPIYSFLGMRTRSMKKA